MFHRGDLQRIALRRHDRRGVIHVVDHVDLLFQLRVVIDPGKRDIETLRQDRGHDRRASPDVGHPDLDAEDDAERCREIGVDADEPAVLAVEADRRRQVGCDIEGTRRLDRLGELCRQCLVEFDPRQSGDLGRRPDDLHRTLREGSGTRRDHRGAEERRADEMQNAGHAMSFAVGARLLGHLRAVISWFNFRKYVRKHLASG